jgi:NAD(P)-dependent dehydrogenase (short-subunit alcohol dehydrogenase family)
LPGLTADGSIASAGRTAEPGKPSDISHTVLFLASGEARYTTGVTLPVDAGALIK